MRCVKGDLLSGEWDTIGHGVNCRGLMGSGIAAAIRAKFPEVYARYRDVCERGELHPGTAQPVWVEKGDATGTVVMNIASQFEPGADASEQWLLDGLHKALLLTGNFYRRDTLAIPEIGAGIGGLTREQVYEVFAEAQARVLHVELVVVEYAPEEAS